MHAMHAMRTLASSGDGVQVVAMLSALKARVAQWDIDGPDNIWIVKPGGKSRGRGIHCFNSLSKLRLQVRADSCQDGQTQQLVAQKYIESPLLAFSRKFDIRQWVLVTCWNPLTVWFYKDCYTRFCAEDYKPSNFDNIFCHLSNNSIAKKSCKFKSGA
jgi:Tubulin-tyrosine ligase family